MKLLTNEQKKSRENAKICYICEVKLKIYVKDKIYCKVRDHWYYTYENRGAAYLI